MGFEAPDRVPQPPDAVLRDYILSAYEPVRPLAGRLASETVLRCFLRQSLLFDAAWPVVRRVRELLGPGETVWGIKRGPDASPQIELYFYNEEGAARLPQKSVGALVSGLQPVLEIDSRLDESIDYFMCSLEIDQQVLSSGRSPGFRIYRKGNRHTVGYDGISYLVTGSELIQENVYLFYRMPDELSEVRERLDASPRAGSTAQRRELLDPNLCDCYSICFAHKRFTDALYFSRIDTQQLIAALRARWPGPLADAIAASAEELAHLRWDLGYDFTAPATDLSAASVQKIGLYGFL